MTFETGTRVLTRQVHLDSWWGGCVYLSKQTGLEVHILLSQVISLLQELQSGEMEVNICYSGQGIAGKDEGSGVHCQPQGLLPAG